MKPTDDKLLKRVASFHDWAVAMLSWVGSRRWTDLLVFGILFLLSLTDDGPWMTRTTCGVTAWIVLLSASERKGSQQWADKFVNEALASSAWDAVREQWGHGRPRAGLDLGPLGPHGPLGPNAVDPFGPVGVNGVDGAVGVDGIDAPIDDAQLAMLTPVHQAALARLARMEGDQAQAFVEQLQRDLANLRNPGGAEEVQQAMEEAQQAMEEAQQEIVLDANGIPWQVTSTTTITFTGNGAENQNPVA